MGVVPGRELAAHQCAVNDDGFSSSICVSALVVGSECRPDERQHYGCCLSLASGRHSVLCPMLHDRRGGSLDRASFGLPDGQVYSVEEKYSGRPTQSS